MDRIRCPINELAEHLPNEPALITDDRTYTWRQFDTLVARARDRFVAQGIKPVARVAIAEPNCVEMIVAIMALIRLGAVPCLLSNRLPAEGLITSLKQCGANAILRFGEHPSVSGARSVVIRDLLESSSGQSVESSISLNNYAAIIFTSGSTEGPKAALLTYGNLYYNALGSNENISFTAGDRWLLSLPLYHVGGLGILFRSILSGGAVIVPKHLNNIVEVSKHLHATHLSLVSTQFIRFVEACSAGVDLQLKAILLGGSAMPGFLVRAGHALGLPLFTSYGMTEMGSQVTTTATGDPIEKLMTSGKLLKYREIFIAADGEILVRGKTRFTGYVNEDILITPFDPDEWYHTGDLGSMDSDGYLHVAGRKDNMFVSGGENIQPEEIERLLAQLEFVMEAAVVAVPDGEFGMRPAAFVRTLDGRPVDERYVVLYLERFLPRFKIPDAFYAWPDLGEGIKVDRKTLTALARQGTS